MTGSRAKNCRILLFLFAFTLVGGIEPARGQDVITDLSERNVPIEWNFNGTQILIFGAIKQVVDNTETPDVVIVVTGPNKKISARRKERIAGIWINTVSMPFDKVPGYYATVSSRPLPKIASNATLSQHGIGLDAIAQRLEVENNGPSSKGLKDFSEAVVRIMRQDGLYRDHPDGVKIIDNSLFRATVSLPANVPIGEFTADVYLFWGGNVLSMQSSPLHIEKKGFEQIVYTLAFDYPMLYGIVAVALAVLAGLAASAIFKRD